MGNEKIETRTLPEEVVMDCIDGVTLDCFNMLLERFNSAEIVPTSAALILVVDFENGKDPRHYMTARTTDRFDETAQRVSQEMVNRFADVLMREANRNRKINEAEGHG